MASPLQTEALGMARPAPKSSILNTRWGRLLIPSMSDMFLIAIVVWLFATGEGWTSLLSDGDIGWHIRVGEYVLDNRVVPKQDLFSFSKPGEPWFAWEWLSDVLFALMHRWMGLKGVALLGGLVLGAWATVLLRRILWAGTNSFAALVLTLLSVGAASIHFLARPHIFTLLFLTVFLWILERDRRAPDRWLWLLAPLMVVWTNLHGGFMAGIACLGLFLAGSVIETLWNRSGDWSQPRRYGLHLGLSGAATFLNPYGYELHRHIFAYLRSDWIRDNVQEFMSPVFRSESMAQFEFLMFAGLMCAAYLISKREVVAGLLVIYFAHMSLESTRHVPLFTIVATPWIGQQATRLWDRMAGLCSPKSILGILDAVARDSGPGLRRTSLWCTAVAGLALVGSPPMRWPADFPKEKFPALIIAEHADLLRGTRVLTTDQWGDYLIYHGYPNQRVFIDGRSDFYGPAIGKEYLKMLQADWETERLLAKYKFDVVLAPNSWPLTTLLKRTPEWRIVRDTGSAVLFRREQKP